MTKRRKDDNPALQPPEEGEAMNPLGLWLASYHRGRGDAMPMLAYRQLEAAFKAGISPDNAADLNVSLNKMHAEWMCQNSRTGDAR